MNSINRRNTPPPSTRTSTTTTEDAAELELIRTTAAQQTATTSTAPAANANATAPSGDAFDAQRNATANTPSAAMGATGAVIHGALMQVQPNAVAVDKALDHMFAGDIKTVDLVQRHPMTENNKIDLLVGGKEAFPQIFQAIDGAKESLNVSYYIFKNDPTGNTFADKLIDAVKRGVDVNISVDGIGSMQVVPESRAILNRLEAGGVNVMRNHVVDFARSGPVFNHPDHRKLVLVDGKTAFTGGMNVADHYVHEYHDVMVKIQGPVVQQMQSEWALSWMNLGGAALNEGGASRQEMKDKLFPEPVTTEKAEGGGMKARVTQGIPGHNKEIFKEVLNLINDAKDSIFIENPYCTNPEIQNALIDAGKRGIEVHVVLPGESDHAFSHMAARAKYPEMLAAGVRIHEYPGFNHGKFMVVDESKVSIGSSNFDDVALRHIYELNINCDDKDFAKSIKERLFDVDIPKCREMKPEDISPMQQATGSFWNLFHDVI